MKVLRWGRYAIVLSGKEDSENQRKYMKELDLNIKNQKDAFGRVSE